MTSVKTRKVTSLSCPPLQREQLDRLIGAECVPEGESNYLEWSVNEKGELELFEEAKTE
jgi:hypothetical protein